MKLKLTRREKMNIKEILKQIEILKEKRAKVDYKRSKTNLRKYKGYSAKIHILNKKLNERKTKPTLKRKQNQPLLTGFFKSVDTAAIQDLILDKVINELSSGNEIAAEKYVKAFETLTKIKKAQ